MTQESQSLAVKGRLIMSAQKITPAPALDSPIMVPANTWQNMVKFLVG